MQTFFEKKGEKRAEILKFQGARVPVRETARNPTKKGRALVKAASLSFFWGHFISCDEWNRKFS